MVRKFLVFCLFLLVAVPAAQAVPPAQRWIRNFQVEDKCIADATKEHPNRDAVSLHLRDVSVDRCLEHHNLPPREHIAPPGDYSAVDAANQAADGDQDTASDQPAPSYCGHKQVNC